MPVNATCGTVHRLLLPALLMAGSCAEPAGQPVAGDPDRGKALIQSYGCGTCHRIRGVPGADGRVGPSLDRVSQRVYLAGVLPNNPEHMVLWIRFPEGVDPLTAMPNLGVEEAHAIHITAYLHSLP